MGQALRCTALALVLALGSLLAWLVPRAPELPDLDVRSVPWQTHAGRLAREHPIGQRFRAGVDGLARIDVAFAPLGTPPPARLELQLRNDGPDGPVVARAEASTAGLGPGGGFVSFTFPPLAGSAGRAYFFAVRPQVDDALPLTTWVRYRGQVGAAVPWGGEAREGPVAERAFRSPLPDLAAIAVPCDGLDPAAGPATLELVDEASGATVATAELAPRAPVREGYAFFPFRRQSDSRWKRYVFRLHVPPGTKVIGDAEGPSFFSLHGGGALDERLLGMAVDGAFAGDRDLVFRTYGTRSVGEVLELLAGRLGPRGALGIVAWIASAALLIAALTRAAATRREDAA